MRLYGYNDTQKFIDSMIEKKWEYIEIDPGSLVIGHAVLLAPDDKHYNFEITEVFLNGWSSAQKIRRFAKISKRLQKEIDAALYSDF